MPDPAELAPRSRTVHGRDSLLRPAPSPEHEWQREVIYFALPDRFSDEKVSRPFLDASNWKNHSCPANFPYREWRWDLWAISGGNRFQGGTIRGVIARLDYLCGLGVTVLWLGPVWKQRVTGVDVNLAGNGDDDVFLSPETGLSEGRTAPSDAELVWPRDDYHGYSIQDFTAVDPRFGTKQDLIDLIEQAHGRGMRVILDIVINHSGVNFTYKVPTLNPIRPPFGRAHGLPEHRYEFGSWLGVDNAPVDTPSGEHDGVKPDNLRDDEFYNRMGEGDYGSKDIIDGNPEYLVGDWRNRDFRYTSADPAADPVLQAMLEIWKNCLTDTDCDGFRIDTFKHIPKRTGREFVRQLLAHAKKEGKDDFLLIAEVAGVDAWGASYLNIDDLRVLELGHRRWALREIAGGKRDVAPRDVLLPTIGGIDGRWDTSIDDTIRQDLDMVTDTKLRDRTVTTVDDHDGVGLPGGTRLARQYGAASVVPAAALLLFGPGIPCLYYGTEQALRGPSEDVTWQLDNYWGSRSDRFLREAMFGPENPRKAGANGHPALAKTALFDENLPGFGPIGTTGLQAFREDSEWYRAIARFTHLREDFPVLADGEISMLSTGKVDGGGFGAALPANIVAWQRIDDGATAIVVVNTARDNGTPVHDITVLLDPRTPKVAFAWQTQQPGEDSGLPRPAETATRPQSGLYYLHVGRIEPGQVNVYTLDAG